MQELVKQFEILEIKVMELLDKYQLLQQNYNELKTTNELLEEDISRGKQKKEITNLKDHSSIYNERPKPSGEALQGLINEIDDCLEILKKLN